MKRLLQWMPWWLLIFPAMGQEQYSAKLLAKAAQPSSLGIMVSTLNNAQREAVAPPFDIGFPGDLPVSLERPYSGYALERAPIPGSCTLASTSICYDYKSGRAVFKPLRTLLPQIAGLQRENISLKRDKITVFYSFK